VLYNRKVDRVLILVVPAALFVYASALPQVRLRSEMPPGFVDPKASADPAQQAKEERLAHEYWNCALNIIHWRYIYGSPLPNTPPEEFHVSARQTSGEETESSTNLRYWHRLQRIWLLPSAWTTTHEWSIHWLTDPVNKGVLWIANSFSDLFHGR
jgi:hypothetical protein